MSLDGQIDDLVVVIVAAGGGEPCVLAGHSWGALLAVLVTLIRPQLVAGLVLLDPADEGYLAALGADQMQEGVRLGESIVAQHASGALPETVRETFRSFAERLSDDVDTQDLIVDAHVWCFKEVSQARRVRDEHQLIIDSLAEIRQRRARGSLPDIPVVVLSATTGQGEREAYTNLHAQLAASVPRGKHIVMSDTSHAMNQERPAEVADAVLRLIEDR